MPRYLTVMLLIAAAFIAVALLASNSTLMAGGDDDGLGDRGDMESERAKEIEAAVMGTPCLQVRSKGCRR